MKTQSENNNTKYQSKPLLVADNKIGEWNTFHIIMKGEKVTVYLNGILVTDNVILENYWDRKIPIFSTAYLSLSLSVLTVLCLLSVLSNRSDV